MSKFRIPIGGLLLFTLIGIVLLLVWPAMPDISNNVRHEKCRENLVEIYRAIDLYIDTHGQLPLDDTGKIDIELLCNGFDPILKDRDVLRCPLNPSKGYVFNPRLAISDFPSNFRSNFGSNGRTVIVAIGQEVQNIVDDRKVTVGVLFSNGSAGSTAIDKDDFSVWKASFVQGIEGAQEFPPSWND